MRRLVCVVLASILLPSLHAQDKDWKNKLENQLKIEYPSRQVGGTFRKEVKVPGTIFALQQGGIRGICESSLVIPYTRVKDGHIVNPTARTKEGEAILKAGDTLVVRDISVDDNQIRIRVTTTDARSVGGLDAGADLQGEKRLTGRECNASILYEFDKDFLKSADLATVKKAINSVLATADEVATANQKTVELGQTIAQVEEMFGKPTAIAKLGTKVIYTYKDMKIIFVNGRVSDVQ
jgi:hypothetical protein